MGNFIASYWPLLLTIILGLTIWVLYEKRKQISIRIPSFKKSKTPKNSANTTATTNTTVTTTKKTSPWTVFWNIVATAAIIFVAVMLFLIVSSITRSCDRPRTPDSASQTHIYKEALVLVDEHDLDDNNPSWTTPYIGYKFKIRTEGHAINIQFTGMKDPVPYPPEGNFSMPSGAQPGPATITRGPGEKRVHVQLYKIITI